jgi:hypothetical protein
MPLIDVERRGNLRRFCNGEDFCRRDHGDKVIKMLVGSAVLQTNAADRVEQSGCRYNDHRNNYSSAAFCPATFATESIDLLARSIILAIGVPSLPGANSDHDNR